MKTFSKAFAMLAAFGLLGMVAYAQKHSARVEVPFTFHVADHVMPAGTYWADVSAERLRLVSEDGKAVMQVFTHDARRSEAKEQTTLIFERYGNAYFLRQVWGANSVSGRELPVTKAEKEIATHQPVRVEVAGL